MAEAIVELRDIRVLFPVRSGNLLPGRPQKVVTAVDGVSFQVFSGEILAMVGESGCGKTTIGKTILRLIEPTQGEIWFRGEDITRVKKEQLRKLRSKIQVIYQDPYESLDPRQSIFDILAEPLMIFSPEISRSEMESRVISALEATGLLPAREIAERYPHHLSGGQRQRVAIAASLILEPDFLVTDEPVSMLDVSIRAEILKLMLDLREKKGLTYLFITHDLSLAWMISDRILVLYLGKIVEIGDAHSVIHDAKHPYTRALVSVIPLPQPKHDRQQIILEGETPSPIDIPPGCRFKPRCWLWKELNQPEICSQLEPGLKGNGSSEHSYACHF